MTTEQTRRRNQIQQILVDRPVATWITDRMTSEEAATFDAAFLKGGQEGQQAIGQFLVRVGRDLGASAKQVVAKAK